MLRKAILIFVISLLIGVEATYSDVLSRLYDFTAGEVISSQEVDDEFNQIINAFSGVSTTKFLSVKNSHAADPVCRFDQLSTGPIAEFKQNGTTKVSINNSGQVVSGLATGTSPFAITSTTVNTNLNADLLDGISSAGFIQASGSSPSFAGLTISDVTPTITFEDTTGGDDDWRLSVEADILTIEDTGGTDAMTFNTTGNAITIAGAATFTGAATFITGPGVANANPTILFNDTAGSDFTLDLDASVFAVELGASDLVTMEATNVTIHGPGSGADMGLIIDSPVQGDSYLSFSTTQSDENDMQFFQSDTTGRFSLQSISTNVSVFQVLPGGSAFTISTPMNFTPQVVAIADNGAGTPAAYNFTPTSSFARFTCDDGNGCVVTMIETSAFDGMIVHVANMGANGVTFDDSAGVLESAGDIILLQYDFFAMMYADDRYIGASLVDN